MNGAALGPLAFPEGCGMGLLPEGCGMGLLDSYNDHLVATGGSRSSKASKKKDDEDDANYTSVMLRNIPNKYTRQMLIDQLHRAGFRGDIDYLYLPTDFANRCNVGYCFVNLRSSLARQRFTNTFDGIAAQTCLPGFNSYKVCQVTKAKWQGRDENIRRLKSGPELMAQLAAHPEWLPLLLDEAGSQEPFLCDENVTTTRSQAAPRRQMRKKGQQQGLGLYPPLGGQPGPEGWMLPEVMGCFPGAGIPGVPGVPMLGRGGHGAGADRGGGRRRKGGRGGHTGMAGGMSSYSDPSGAAQAYASTMMPVPVMTESGLQYMPYDGYEGGGYFLAYPTMGADQQLYGVSYPGAYGAGYPGWWGSEPAGSGMEGLGTGQGRGSQRGKRRGGSNSNAVAESDPQELEDMLEGM